MATVTGKTSEKIDSLLAAMVTTGQVDAQGNVTLTTKGGTVINAGSISNSIVGAAINNLGRLILTNRQGGTIDIGRVAANPLDAWPVTSIFFAASSTNPSVLLGGGTWQPWGVGRMPVGVDPAQSEFDTLEETGGEKSHILTVAEMPAHSHSGTAVAAGAHDHPTASTMSATSPDTGHFMRAGPSGTVSNNNLVGTAGSHAHAVTTVESGGGASHNNLPPYITCYMWKRTA